MKSIISFLVLAIALAIPSTSFAIKPTTTSFKGQLHVMKATYSFATQGGGTGTINLLDRNGVAATLPAGAIIKKVIIDVTSAMSSTSNDGTIALQSEAAGDLLATVDADTLSNQVAGLQTGASVANVVKLTTQKVLKMVVATHALLGGAFTVWVEYYI